mgnify:CR=1 FL=1
MDTTHDASAPKPESHGNPLFVVGIGASAGGLEAIQTFFDNASDRTGAAFVVVQHLSPDFKSMMGELLSKNTAMPIHTVTEPIEMAPNEIYLIPPKRHLLLKAGRLIPEDYPADQALNLPINVFFRSLAENYGERAVAIVLSGTGSDGAMGVRSVREMGGVVMVQDESSARFEGMPHSAMATGAVDFVLAPQDMPSEIERYIRYENDGKVQPTIEPETTDADRLSQILGMVHQESRIDFSQYKVNTIMRRVGRRIGLTQSVDVEGYIDLLRSSPTEVRTLGQELLISVTSFFRDPDAFDILASDHIPELVRSAAAGGELRLWVAGCATGEEAYSLAILVHEEIERQGVNLPFKVFATDIDRRAIERAATGVYHTGFMSNVSEDRLRAYFTQRSDNYQVTPTIREKVIFAVHDLVKDPPFTRIDLIACRNLLIYFQPVLQHRALSRMLFALRPEGTLFLGPSETTGELSREFHVSNSRWKLLRKRSDARVITPGELHQETRTQSTRGWSPGAGNTEWTVNTAYGPHERDVVENAVRQYVPAGVALSRDLKLIHIFGAIERYFRFPSGAPNFDVVRLARGELSVPLATAVHRALKDQCDVVYDDVHFTDVDGERHLTLRVTYCQESRSEQPYLMAFFEPRDVAIVQEKDTSGSTPTDDLKAKQRIDDLEQELQYTGESLQTTIEELETSNEELQSSNEGLMGANEELQSTNEELNSVNEELYTVNAEYQKKIDELIELNADMDQLLTSSSVAVLFLDRDLRVRRFTESARELFHILEPDVGRPIAHLSPRFEIADLQPKIEHVRSTREIYEEEVTSEDGRTHLLSIRPHSAITERLAGIVLTFYEITRIRQAQNASKAETHRLEAALEAMGAGAMSWRRGETSIRTSGKIAETLGLDPGDAPTDLEALVEHLRTHLDEGQDTDFDATRLLCFRSKCSRCSEQGEAFVDRWRLKDGRGSSFLVQFSCSSLSHEDELDVVMVLQRIPEAR